MLIQQEVDLLRLILCTNLALWYPNIWLNITFGISVKSNRLPSVMWVDFIQFAESLTITEHGTSLIKRGLKLLDFCYLQTHTESCPSQLLDF